MEKLKSIKLLLVYNEVLQVVSQLDATFLNLLKTSEGDVPANIKRRMEGIENKEYVVLVAGALTFYHHSKFFFLTQFDCDRFKLCRAYCLKFISPNVASFFLELNSKKPYRSSGKEKASRCLVFTRVLHKR